MLQSSNGEDWQALDTTVIAAQHSTQSETRALGYFAVASPREPPAGSPQDSGARTVIVIAVAGGVVLVGAVSLLLIARRRRQRSSSR